MNIFFDNVDLDSSSGPNTFAQKLILEFVKSAQKFNVKGNIFSSPEKAKENNIDIQLSFIHSVYEDKEVPIIQRLDGIYFNSLQDWKSLNAPIRETYEKAAGVIFQSRFNKMLTEHYFGKKENSVVINNGVDLDRIEMIPANKSPELDKFENIWVCASSWRPHKRPHRS
jgi:glycosyltransferase involved in cell wall biosynthesis